MSDKKIVIGIPHTGIINTDVMNGILNIRSQYALNIQMLKSSILYISRENLAKAAINSNIDYLMFLDSDQVIQPDTVDRMAKYLDEGEDIVTTLIFRKDPPYHPCVFSESEELPNRQISLKFYDIETADLSKPFYVDSCGMGCMMMKVSVLKSMPEPWFLPRPYTGEDISFIYDAVKKFGYKILCDPTIEIGHIGTKNYNRNDYFKIIENEHKLLDGSVTPEVYL